MLSKLIKNSNIMSINSINGINDNANINIKRFILTIIKPLINNKNINKSNNCILNRNIITDLRDLGKFNYYYSLICL